MKDTRAVRTWEMWRKGPNYIGWQLMQDNWWQFFDENRRQFDGNLSRKTYRRSTTTARSCVNKRDQREGEGDEQDHCYRPATKNIFLDRWIFTFFMGPRFLRVHYKGVLVGPKYYHLFFLKNWPLFRVTKATAIGLRWKKVSAYDGLSAESIWRDF